MEGNRGQCGRRCGVSDPYEREAARAAIHTLRRELAEVTNQRDLLVEGLEKLASCDWVITLPDRMDAVKNIANETLNKIKP